MRETVRAFRAFAREPRLRDAAQRIGALTPQQRRAHVQRRLDVLGFEIAAMIDPSSPLFAVVNALGTALALDRVDALEGLANEADKLRHELLETEPATQARRKDRMLDVAQAWLNGDMDERRAIGRLVSAASGLGVVKLDPFFVLECDYSSSIDPPEVLEIQKEWQAITKGKKRQDAAAYVKTTLRVLGVPDEQVKGFFEYRKQRAKRGTKKTTTRRPVVKRSD